MTDSLACTVGGTVGIAIASSIFGTRLGSSLREFAPEAPFDLVRNSVEVRRRLTSCFFCLASRASARSG